MEKTEEEKISKTKKDLSTSLYNILQHHYYGNGKFASRCCKEESEAAKAIITFLIDRVKELAILKTIVIYFDDGLELIMDALANDVFENPLSYLIDFRNTKNTSIIFSYSWSTSYGETLRSWDRVYRTIQNEILPRTVADTDIDVED